MMSSGSYTPLTVDAGSQALTLMAFFDESGTHADSEAVAVAGFLATPAAWQAFEADWLAALTDFDIPFFRMSSFANRVGRYAKWSEESRQKRLTRLLDIINAHVIGSVGNVVPVALYERLFSPNGPARRKSGGPYGLAMAATIMSVAEIVRELAGAPQVAYVFESGAVGRHEASKVFTDNLNDPIAKEHFRLLSLTFEDKRNLVPLQAADILAYELYRELPRQLARKPRLPRHPLVKLKGMPTSWGWLNEDQLKTFAYVMTLGTEFGLGTWHK